MIEDEGTVTEHSGPSGQLKSDSIWLAAEDLPIGRDVVVKIESVLLLSEVPMDKGRKYSGGALAFEKKDKRLILNSGKRKTLNRLFTTDTAEWPGKSITIYADPNVMFGRKKVGGIVIRDQAVEDHSNRATELAGGAPEPLPPGLCGKACGDPGLYDEPQDCVLAAGHDGECKPCS